MVESRNRYIQQDFDPDSREMRRLPTAREMEVLTLAAKGLSNKEIAEALPKKNGEKGSRNTVRIQMENICDILCADNRFNAVIIAIKHKILDLEELTKGMDKESFLKLTTWDEKETLKMMVSNDGRNSTHEEIADKLSTPDKKITKEVIKTRFLNMNYNLNLNQVQLGLLYLAINPPEKKNVFIPSENVLPKPMPRISIFTSPRIRVENRY